MSWSGVAGAESYRIQVLERSAGGFRVVAQATVGDARAWTPPDCLAEGGEYAWRARGDGPGRRWSWSEPVRFRVEERDSLRAALTRVAERLAEEGRLTAEELDRLRQSGLFRDPSRMPAPVPAPRPIPFTPPNAAADPVASRPAPSHTGGDASVHVADQAGTGAVAIGLEYGVYSEAQAPSAPVGGRSTTMAFGRGVYGVNENAIDGGAPAGTVAVGVRGTGEAAGVRGTSKGPVAAGVAGFAELTAGLSHGVVGESRGIQGKGVEGRATGLTGTNYGVFADTNRAVGAFGISDFYAGGAGTDYGPFTGAHLVRIADGSGAIPPGAVVAFTGAVEALEDGDGSLHLSSTLPTVRLATTARDPRVLGAFVGEVTLEPDHPWASGGEGRIGAVNALGEGRIWVTDANGSVVAGDYLTSSAVPGHAQRQGKPELMPYTVAKAIETVDWSTAETVRAGGRTFRAALVAVVYTGG